jgi:hypothetical protein
MRRFTGKGRALVAFGTLLGAAVIAVASPLTAMAANWGP